MVLDDSAIEHDARTRYGMYKYTVVQGFLDECVAYIVLLREALAKFLNDLFERKPLCTVNNSSIKSLIRNSKLFSQSCRRLFQQLRLNFLLKRMEFFEIHLCSQ